MHFFLIGFLIFALYAVFDRSGMDRGRDAIAVDNDALLEYLQFRNRSFDPERFASVLEAMESAERERLVADYVREEALYREAKAMRLDSHDYVARLRLVQQLEYLTKAAVERDLRLTMEDVREFYRQNRESYHQPPTLTFTHVFVRRDPAKDDAALYREATLLKDRLEQDGVRFGASGAYGDRFLYHLNYVDKSEQELAGHFGEAMAKQLFEIPVSPSQWQGPLASPYGYHLLLLVRKTEGVTPALEQILTQVERDAYDRLLNRRTRQALDDIVERYRVEEAGVPAAAGKAEDDEGGA